MGKQEQKLKEMYIKVVVYYLYKEAVSLVMRSLLEREEGRFVCKACAVNGLTAYGVQERSRLASKNLCKQRLICLKRGGSLLVCERLKELKLWSKRRDVAVPTGSCKQRIIRLKRGDSLLGACEPSRLARKSSCQEVLASCSVLGRASTHCRSVSCQEATGVLPLRKDAYKALEIVSSFKCSHTTVRGVGCKEALASCLSARTSKHPL